MSKERVENFIKLDNHIRKEILLEIKSNKNLSPHLLTTYIELFSYCNLNTHRCNVCYETLLKILPLTKRTLIGCIKTLEEKGFIIIVKTLYKSNEYYFPKELCFDENTILKLNNIDENIWQSYQDRFIIPKLQKQNSQKEKATREFKQMVSVLNTEEIF